MIDVAAVPYLLCAAMHNAISSDAGLSTINFACVVLERPDLD
ncbi:hypothetical protein [Hyphomicrobium sp. D-2]|nr:hypothetical protein [Hyphomicrobium sp. D-2]MDH4981219.1 hypothetical protein [Hyphomicrobium sp. D-2]